MLPAMILLLSFILLLLFPSVVAAGAAAGLLAWYRNVLPILFPYMVFTGLMVKTGAAKKIAAVFYPVLGRLFSLSIPGTYALLCGLLCGYPMGAAITANLHTEGEISPEEASYLLTFVNLPSPSFLIGYVLHSCYPNSPLPAWSPFAALYTAGFLISLITRRWYHIQRSLPKVGRPQKECLSFIKAIDEGIAESFGTQLKICGCMIFYSALTELFLTGLLQLHGLLPEFIIYLTGAIPEVTSGIKRLSAWSQMPLSFAAACGLCAFGGISVTAQTYAVTNDSTKARQPLGGYLACKILYGIMVFGILYGISLIQ